MNDLSLKAAMQYCSTHSTTTDDVLLALERETNLTTVTPQMIAGSYQGKLIELICAMVSPEYALEIGTFTGYSAICIARGLKEGGTLHTIEVNPEREEIIRKYIGLAGLQDRIKLHIGNGLEVISTLNHTYQFVFIDAGKRDNAKYYDLVIDRVSSGGVLILDNVLWGGKVVLDPDDKDAKHIRAINTQIAKDPRVECLMLPIRDGMTIIRKK